MLSGCRAAAWVVAVVGTLALAVAAEGHERSISYSIWRFDGARVHVTLRLAALDLTRLPPGSVPSGTALGDVLADQLELRAPSAACVRSSPTRQLDSAGGRLAFEWTLRCPTSDQLVLRSTLLRAVAPSHLHFARVFRNGAVPEELVLSFDRPERALATSTATATLPRPGTFVALGVEHIAGGLDHLAFLAALLLGATSLGDVARVVTGFTVGHSLTLAAATVGWIAADRAAVDALIGASIALVALESLWAAAARPAWMPWLGAAGCLGLALGRRTVVPPAALAGLALAIVCSARARSLGASPGGLRWSVAALFGCIHGLGFAAVLADAAWPSSRAATALLGFNVGVELAQLALVVLVWPALAMLRRAAALGTLATDAGHAALLAAGLWWFLVRAHA